jgi:excinuclease UvrABC nuclease subunit
VVGELLNSEWKDASRTEYVQFASLWKGKARERKWKNAGEVEQLLVLNHKTWQISTFAFQYDQIDQLLIKLRDEAHRFANQYRKKQMSKEFSVSPKR